MNMTISQATQAINLPGIGQLGILVPSIDESQAFYEKILNIKPWYRADIVEETIYFEGKTIDLTLDIVVGYSNGVQVELIEIVSGDRNLYTGHLETRGHGLHHLGFYVRDIDKGLRDMKAAGLEPIQHGTLKTKGNAVTRFAYFDTVEQCGYVTELIETKLYGIYVGSFPLLMKVGTLTGDVERVGG